MEFSLVALPHVSAQCLHGAILFSTKTFLRDDLAGPEGTALYLMSSQVVFSWEYVPQLLTSIFADALWEMGLHSSECLHTLTQAMMYFHCVKASVVKSVPQLPTSV